MESLLARLGVQYPIFLSPLGGGPSTPELAAAVTNGGGLGAIAAAYLSPREIAETVRRTRELAPGPLNVNLFASGGYRKTEKDSGPMLKVMAELHQELGLPAPQLPEVPPEPFDEQFEAVLAARPQVFSFTFGIPHEAALKEAKRAGMLIFGTATTVEEGRQLESAGVDAVLAQGSEAGGQRGTFAGDFEEGLVPLMELLSGLVRAVKVPVIASGGLMDGKDVARVLRAGADAAQLGTAFLACPESGTSAPYKKALLAAGEGRTAITYAFTGRAARGLENRFTRTMEKHKDDVLPFPFQNLLTREMRKASAMRGNAEYLSLFAGTGVGRIRALPAAELMGRLVEEMKAEMKTEGNWWAR